MIDIGGASTELIGEHSEAKLLNSLHMGCVTWLNNHFGDGELSRPASSRPSPPPRRCWRRWRKIIVRSVGVPVSAPPARCRHCKRSCWRRGRASGSPAQAARADGSGHCLRQARPAAAGRTGGRTADRVPLRSRHPDRHLRNPEHREHDPGGWRPA
ncbi:hypothetical protein H2136_00300 [Aeromonas hydrophila]|uniref:Ppx/GppA phosphatase N-terminal domain-containing protein n=1 Tax=Aeromonas hydrophila TaxID=644 RepID=A0A926IYX0_AERHY|nr:hypothetical protein [Aeromonas hydrophila]